MRSIMRSYTSTIRSRLVSWWVSSSVAFPPHALPDVPEVTVEAVLPVDRDPVERLAVDRRGFGDRPVGVVVAPVVGQNAQAVLAAAFAHAGPGERGQQVEAVDQTERLQPSAELDRLVRVSGVSPGNPRMKEARAATPASAHIRTAASTCARVIPLRTVRRMPALPDSIPKLTAVQPAAFMRSSSSRVTVSTRANAVQRTGSPRRRISSHTAVHRSASAVNRSSAMFTWWNPRRASAASSSTTWTGRRRRRRAPTIRRPTQKMQRWGHPREVIMLIGIPRER